MRAINNSLSFTVLSALTALVVAGCAGDARTGEKTEDYSDGSEQDSSEYVSEARQSVQQCVTFQRGLLGNVADSQIASDPGKSTKNYGAGLVAIAGKVGPGQRKALFQFDLSSIPSGSTIDSATLTLKGNNDSHPAGGPTNVSVVGSAWSENSVTWDTAPTTGASAGTLPGGPGFQTLSLTSLVSAWYSGATPNHGLILDQGGFYYTSFATSEAAAAGDRPKLDVCYTPPAPSGTPITPVGEAYGHHGACSGWNQCGNAATCALWACYAQGYSTLVSYGEEKPCTQWGVCHLFHSPCNGGPGTCSIQYNWGNWCDVAGVGGIVCQ